MSADDMPAEKPDLSLRPEEAWPFYAEDEIASVADVLRSGKVNQWTGPHVNAFACACEERFGGRHGIALANGSLALELALRAFRVGPGDEVIVSPRSFMASASCVPLVGAVPVFADVDAESGNITRESVERVLTDRTRAIIPVHLAGWPADVPGIMDLVQGRDIAVIEDCAQAHGAMIGDRSVGSFGNASAFSFCQDKIISTGGEGGYASFQDETLWRWAWSYKDHGKSMGKTTGPGSEKPGMFRYVHDRIGTNWRLTGPQAVIGLEQLKKLERWTMERTRNANIWVDALSRVRRLRVPLPGPNVRHAFYKLYAFIDGGSDEQAAALRSRLIERAQGDGLRVFSGSCSEIYLEEPFKSLPRPDCPVAHSLGMRSLMFEVHPTLRPGLLQLRAERFAAIAGEVLGCA